MLLILASGAGTLWWAATHRTIPGQPSAAGSSPGEQTTPWTPVVLDACSKVEIGQERAAGTERCQRTRNTDAPQHWVEAPPTGFPIRSNPNGPFPGEDCPNQGDIEYSPTGDHLTCRGETWQVRT